MKTPKNLIFNVRDVALEIEQAFISYLKEPKKGLYVDNVIEPVIVPTKAYYWVYKDPVTGVFTQDPVLDLNGMVQTIGKFFKGRVADEDGVTVYDPAVHGIAYDHPTVPARGLEILKHYLTYLIDKKLPWVKSSASLSDRIKHLFLEGYEETKVAVVHPREMPAGELIQKDHPGRIPGTIERHFHSRQYPDSVRVLVEYQDIGSVWVPAEMAETVYADPLIEWVEDYLHNVTLFMRVHIAAVVEAEPYQNFLVSVTKHEARIEAGGDVRSLQTEVKQDNFDLPSKEDLENSHANQSAAWRTLNRMGAVPKSFVPPGEQDKPIIEGLLDDLDRRVTGFRVPHDWSRRSRR